MERNHKAGEKEMTDKTREQELKDRLKECPEDDVDKAELKGIKEGRISALKDVKKIINEFQKQNGMEITARKQWYIYDELKQEITKLEEKK